MILIFKTDLTTGGKRLFNLLHISFFDLKKNKIVYHHAYNRTSIVGNFIFFGGGDNTEEEVEKDFGVIQKKIKRLLP